MSPLLEWSGQVLGSEWAWVRDLVLVSGLLWGLVLALMDLEQESE